MEDITAHLVPSLLWRHRKDSIFPDQYNNVQHPKHLRNDAKLLLCSFKTFSVVPWSFLSIFFSATETAFCVVERFIFFLWPWLLVELAAVVENVLTLLPTPAESIPSLADSDALFKAALFLFGAWSSSYAWPFTVFFRQHFGEVPLAYITHAKQYFYGIV